MDRFVHLWRRRRSVLVLPRWGGGSVTAVVLLLVATVLGYGYLYARMDGARPARGNSSGLGLACRQPPVFFPGSPPYRGPGPHLMAVYHQPDQSLPPAWVRADADGSRPGSQQDSAEVQLVACAERVQEERTRRECRLGSGETPLYRAVYRVRILEARTGRRVSEHLVRPGAEQCPRFVHLDPRNPKAYTLPSPQDYARQLDDVIDQPAPQALGARPGTPSEAALGAAAP
ncbi:hypothetical protein ACFZAV_27590 [Streptomyces sp. NPDC008343]|uniref:hypothetical protein n=1 Tax=Streptomyces sp. NPDC008343 TaxID=3364828 RepID=UPI0036ED825D